MAGRHLTAGPADSYNNPSELIFKEGYEEANS